MRLERTKYSTTLLLSCGLLALGACGDDGPSETGAGTATEGTGTSTGTPMTTEVSVDTTAGPGPGTTTEDPTTGVDTTAAEESTTGDPPPSGAIAFRFNSIALTDPTAGFPSSCNNADQVNGLLQAGLSSDEDGDGFLDMGFVLNFHMLDQADGASGDIDFANAECTAPDGLNCGLLGGSDLYETTYSVITDGICLAPDPALTDPTLAEPAGTTTGPCFVTEPIDAVIVTSALSLPLSDARIAAQFVGQPAGNLVEGTIQGFLSEADAAAATVEFVGIPFTLSQLLCNNHNDGGGWWMHMNFTAVTTEWDG